MMSDKIRRASPSVLHELDALRAEKEASDKVIDTLTTDLNACVDLCFELGRKLDALRAENERIEAEFRAEIQTEHAAYQELHRKNERLRAAAQDVIDSINEENEINPDAIARLSQVLVSHKRA